MIRHVWRMFLLLWSIFINVTLASVNTRTELICRTFYGSQSAYEIATHTRTIITREPTVTVAFVTKEISTLTHEKPLTFNKTETSISTITTTVTQKLTDNVFTSTSTVYTYQAKPIDIVTVERTKVIHSTTSTDNFAIPTNVGFAPILERLPKDDPNVYYEVTTRPDLIVVTKTFTMAAPANPIKSGQVEDTKDQPMTKVMVKIDGELVPTEMAVARLGVGFHGGVSGLETDLAHFGVMSEGEAAGSAINGDANKQKSNAASLRDSRSGPLEVTKPDSSYVVDDNASLNPLQKIKPPEAALPNQGNIAEAIGHLQGAQKNKRSLEMTEKDDRLAVAESEKLLQWQRADQVMGLRGALNPDPAKTAGAFPTLVSCIKSYIRATTTFSPTTKAARLVPPPEITNIITTVSVLTHTITVPNRVPFKTSLFVTTSTLTTLSVTVKTSTQVEALNYTISVTSTVYPACESSNFLGPVINEERQRQITNLYLTDLSNLSSLPDDNDDTPLSKKKILGAGQRAVGSYATYVLGRAETQSSCCEECHSLSLAHSTSSGKKGYDDNMACLGSVFARDKGQCYLFLDKGSHSSKPDNGGEKEVGGRAYSTKCTNGARSIGFFVAQNRNDKDLQDNDKYIWPDYVLSNGPCGFFSDGGRGW